MRGWLTSLLVLMMLLPNADAYAVPRQTRARRAATQQERLPQSNAPGRAGCPAPVTKYKGVQTEPLRFVRVEGCTVIWRNVYNNPRIADLRLTYAGVNPVPAGTQPSTVFSVTRTVGAGQLVSARLDPSFRNTQVSLSPSTTAPPSSSPPAPVPPPRPTSRSTSTPTSQPKPKPTPSHKEGWVLPKAEPR